MVQKSVLIIMLFSFASCNQSNSSDSSASHEAGFEIVDSGNSGIDFINALEDDPLSDKNVLSYPHYFNGAGVGVGDFNNDGLQDIFFAGNEVPNAIYINKGEMKFEKLGTEAGINTNKVWASGVSIVDINADGYDDIYVCQQGPYEEDQRKNLFFINNGDLTFTERAAEMGLDDGNYSTQACFFDYDKDGDLDCYVMNESKYARVILRAIYEDLEKEENMVAASGKLFENTGNLKFKDVTKQANVLNYGYGLGLNVSDFNGDNWPDIYVANDYTVPDFLYINQKDGTFKESIKEYTRQISYFGMGCDVADINNDGLVDIGVVDMAAEDHFRDKTLMAGMDVEAFKYYFNQKGYQLQYMFNSLQLNNGNNSFSNIAAMAGVLKSDWSWAAFFSDFNYDGYKDYYVSNGYRRYARDNDFMIRMEEVRRQHGGTIPLQLRNEMYALMPEVKLKNKLYINDKNLHFSDDDGNFTHPEYDSYSYGVAQGDFDNDGDIDLIVNNIDQEALLLKNTILENTSRNYIKIKLNADNPALELTSKVYVETGDIDQLQEYYFVRGYESCMEECLFFGLDDYSTIDKITIIWPDNTTQELMNVQANQVLIIDYAPTGQFKIPEKATGVFDQIDCQSAGIDFEHRENPFDDFATEILLPQKQTAFGPALATGDVNNDGLEDFFIGGAKAQAGALYLQVSGGSFEKFTNQPWTNESYSEDVDAQFIDVNQDGNLDLFILSGGSGDFLGQEAGLVDRFYAGDGTGNFFRIANVVPDSPSASYSIVSGNIDSDPELEIMILGAAKPGKYPLTERSVLYDYVDKSFQDITDKIIPQLNDDQGLIRDAVFVDLNMDGQSEIITVGEWQEIHVYEYDGTRFKKQSKQWLGSSKNGWWRSITAADLDNDGDQDLIVGNVGKNFKQKATKEYPLYLYSNDFDDNGTLDCVLAKPYKGKVVPARGKECSTEQMPFVSEKFKTYRDFASASIVDIYGQDKIEGGISLEANDFYSYILWNNSTKLEYKKLPVLAQAFPVNASVTMDVNNDGLTDIVLAGNDYNTEYETPRLDAGNGLLLINKGNHLFEALSVPESGIFCSKDVKRMESIRIDGKPSLLVANNNDAPDLLALRKDPS